MNTTTSKGRLWATHTITLIAGVIAAIAGVYLNQHLRTSKQVDVSIISIERTSPKPESVYINPRDLLILDVATEEDVPKELESVHMKHALEFVRSLEDVDPTDPLSKMPVMQALRGYKYPIPMEVGPLRSALDVIERNPSSLLTTGDASDLAETIENLPIDTPANFSQELNQFLNDSAAFRANYNLEFSSEASTLERMISDPKPSDAAALLEIRDKLLESATAFDEIAQNARHTTTTTVNRVRRLVEQAEADADGTIRMEVRVTISNSGQTPLVISRFGILEIDENFLIPIQTVDISNNMSVFPGVAKEVLFSTPNKAKGADFWSTLMQHRNRGSTTVVCRFLDLSDGSAIRSDVTEFLDVSRERESVIKKLLGPGESLPLDLDRLY